MLLYRKKRQAKSELSDVAAKSSISSRHTRSPAWTSAHGNQPRLKLQRKLTINQPGDVYEQEADRVAGAVMRMPVSDLQRQSIEEENEDVIQTKRASGNALPYVAPASVHKTLRSPGQQLDASTRAFMEPRFGQDFGDVRVHTSSQAAQSAADVNARAYTVGQNIAFGTGQYAPGTQTGDTLIAHELAHTVQQQSGNRLFRQEDKSPSVSRDIVIPLAFPDYLIQTPVGKVSELGHAGVLIIKGTNGRTKYFEYGRYDSEGLGIVRQRRIPDVKIGKNNRPTPQSLQRTLRSISKQAGQSGRILAAYIDAPGQYEKMLQYAIKRKSENRNSAREPYSLFTNNCMHFAKEVAEAGGVSTPWLVDPRPTSYIDEIRDEYPNVDYTDRSKK